MTFFTRLAAPVAALTVALPAFAAEWNLPTPYPDVNFHTQNILQFAEDVKAATDGGFVITVHPGQSLVKHPEIKTAVRRGVVQAGEILASRLSNENPIFGLDSLPFVATSYDAARKLYELSRPQIEAALEEQDLVLLFSIPWPPQGIYTIGAVDDPAEFEGRKFRAYNASTERVAQLLGMAPTQVEASDIATAFATGRVNVTITSASTGSNIKAWDFVDHYYDAQAWLPRDMVFTSKAALAALTDDERAALMEAAKAAEARGWAASRKVMEEKTNVLRENGMTVSPPSDAVAAKFREVGATMAAEWLEAYPDGAEIIAQMKE